MGKTDKEWEAENKKLKIGLAKQRAQYDALMRKLGELQADAKEASAELITKVSLSLYTQN